MTTPTIRAMAPSDREAAIALLLDSEPWRLAPARLPLRGLEPAVRAASRGPRQLRRRGRWRTGRYRRRTAPGLLGDYLELLAFATPARGRGLATALLQAIEAEVFARNRNFCACVSDFNAPARAFYRRLGYLEVGPLPGLVIAGSAEILLHKTSGPLRGGDAAGQKGLLNERAKDEDVRRSADASDDTQVTADLADVVPAQRHAV